MSLPGHDDAFMSQLRPGAWIKVFTSQGSGSSSGGVLPCWHHGIVSGVDGASVRVIHFCRPEEAQAQDAFRVLETSLEWFVQGGTDAQVVDAEPSYAYDEVVSRARQFIGVGGYSLPTRNCEHFASWCFAGSAFSQQVYMFGAGAGVVSVALAVLAVFAMSMARSRWA
jgi:hypothetical protein